MSLVDSLKNAGFKPEKSTEGEFKPLEGVYNTQFVKAEEKPANDKGGKQLQVEFKVVETLAGDIPKNSKFNEFKKYLAIEGENEADKKKGIPWIINALFTAGVEVSGTTDEELMASIQGAIGTNVYIRAYGFTPEDGDKSYQMIAVMKEAVAIKKAEDIKKKNGHPL